MKPRAGGAQSANVKETEDKIEKKTRGENLIA